MNPYENLANAIVLQAVKDYRKALKYPNSRMALCECRSIERFFRSGWFSVLTNIDPEVLITKLKAEVAA